MSDDEVVIAVAATSDVTEMLLVLLQKVIYADARHNFQHNTKVFRVDTPEECHLCSEETVFFVDRDPEDDKDYICVLCAMAMSHTTGYARGISDAREAIGALPDAKSDDGQSMTQMLGLLTNVISRGQAAQEGDAPTAPTGQYL